MLDYSLKERTLLGLRIHALTLSEVMEVIEESFNEDESIIIYGFSANIYSRLRNTPEFIYFFRKMDVVVPDGQGIPILAKLFNVDIKERVGIVNLSNEMLKIANKSGLRIMLLGAAQDINQSACKRITEKYPDIKSCVGINGYFQENEEEEIVRKIAAFKPDILYIGISSPIKERFALKYKEDLNAKLIIPCGGWIDVMSGKVKRPPFILRKLPVTWLFRFIQEPKRMFGPIIITMLDTIFVIFPALYFKHILGIEKNPSIIKHLRLEKKIPNTL